MKKLLSLTTVAVAMCTSMIFSSCGDNPEKDYEKAKEYLYVKEDFETGMKYLEKAAKGGHQKAQKELEGLKMLQKIGDEAKKTSNKKEEANIQPQKPEEKKGQVKSNISVDDQLKDLRKAEVALKNRAEKIIAAKYDQKHTFGEHTQAMRKAMNTIASLFQRSLSATDEKSKARIIAQIQEQFVIAEQNAEWIEVNAPLRQSVVALENDYIKKPLSTLLALELQRGDYNDRISSIIDELRQFEKQIDNLLDATDFKDAETTCKKSIPNIIKLYVEIGDNAVEDFDVQVCSICYSVLSKLDHEQGSILEQKWSDKNTKFKQLKQQIEQQIEKNDWSNAEKTIEELRKFNVNVESYQRKISYGKEHE